jgi:hypothetical protein
VPRPRLRRLAVTSLTALALVVTSNPASAITWGVEDGFENDHVVTLLFQDAAEDWYSCSGTLLSTRLVLTAGHCTEAGGH